MIDTTTDDLYKLAIESKERCKTDVDLDELRSKMFTPDVSGYFQRELEETKRKERFDRRTSIAALVIALASLITSILK